MSFGKRLVADHMAQMNAMSEQEQEPIVEWKGYRITVDRPYQGFDNRPEWGYPAERFWCRHIEVERTSDGVRGYGVGFQADAYKDAIRRILAAGIDSE